MDNSLKPVTSGLFISGPAAEVEAELSHWQLEKPSFRIENVQLQFDLRNELQRLLVSNNCMYVLSVSCVYRIDLNNPSFPSKISIPQTSEGLKVSDWWLHPSGKFLIVKVSDYQYFHLHHQYSKFKVLPRLRGLNIEHICFSGSSTDLSTGDFLLSTKDGNIYVANLKCHEPGSQDKKRDDKFVKQVYKVGGLIHGLSFSNNYTQVQVFVDNEMQVWDCFEPVLTELTRMFRQTPKKLSIQVSDEPPLFFAARLKYYLVVQSTGDIYSNDEEIQMSPTDKMNLGKYSLYNGPESFIVTLHHIICLSATKDTLIVFNKLVLGTPMIVSLGPRIPPQEQIFGLVSDCVGNTHWIFTSNGIHEIVISDESISVWYNYYKLGNFEQALKLLEVSEASEYSLKKNVVLVKQGYDLLQRGDFGLEIQDDNELFKLQLRGIKQLARLQEPFEKVCLMLMELRHSSLDISLVSKRLLVEYLKLKFTISKESENKTRIVVLSSWIVLLLLRVIQTLQSQLRYAEIENSDTPNISEKSRQSMRRTLDEFSASLDDFLKANYRVVDSKTIYEILGRMDFPRELVSFAELMEDYDFILDYYIEKEMWSDALRSLSKLFIKNKEKALEAIQRSSTVLLMNYAPGTIEAWLRFPEICYEALLPAILTYNRNREFTPFNQNPTILFFLRLIFENGLQSKVIHDYYLSLLITYPSHSGDDDVIMNAILETLDHIKKEALHHFRKDSQYDSEFLLRLCLKYKRFDAAVRILVKDMRLFDTALKLAMDHKMTSSAEFVLRMFDEHVLHDSKLGDAENANNQAVEDYQFMNRIQLDGVDFASRKRLWMIYAKYLIAGVCNGIQFEVLENMKEVLFAEAHSKRSGISQIGSITTIASIGQMEEKMDIKLKSENLNKVMHYILHLAGNEGESLNILSLKDLLPLLPEDVLITSFKDEIVSSLDYYNNSINQLSLEMQESAEIAEKLKGQILASEAREKSGSVFTIIEPGEPCQQCGKLLMDKNFVAFRNCHHCFHKDCAVRYYLQLKGDYRFKKIFQNFKMNSSIADEKELDNMLLSYCFLCNESNISTIDEFLMHGENNKNDVDDWDIKT